VVFIAFLAYNATPFLRAYSLIGISFLASLLRSDIATTPAHLFRVSGWLFWVQIVNYVAIATLTAMFVGEWWMKRRDADIPYWHHFLWLAGFVRLAIGFFAWNGLLGMQQRLLQLGTLFSAVGIAIVTARRRSAWHAHGVVGAVAISAAVISVPFVHIGNNALITDDEWAALHYYASEVGCDHVLFTDFRIGPAATYLGCFNVIGPTAAALARSGQTETVDHLFYSTDTGEIIDAIDTLSTTDGRPADLILVSDEMTKREGGIVLPDGRLEPLPTQVRDAYLRLPGWQVIYRNPSVSLLERTTSVRAAEAGS